MLTAVESQVTVEGREIVELGRSHGYRFRFIMQAGKIVEPLYLHQDGEDFYIIPREQDTSEIPPQADRAVGLIVAAGYDVVQQLVAHDMEGFESFKMPEREEVEIVEIDVEERVESVENNLKNIGKAVAAAVGAMVTGTAAILGFFTLALVDPALIVVIKQDDGTHIWVEVANWMEA